MKVENDHPEATCQSCGGPNVVWFADSILWNQVSPQRTEILCPVCFIQKAEALGLGSIGWRVAPSEDWPEKAAMLQRDQAQREEIYELRAALVRARAALEDSDHA